MGGINAALSNTESFGISATSTADGGGSASLANDAGYQGRFASGLRDNAVFGSLVITFGGK